MRSRIIYNPDLTIKEISERCGVSVSAVRRYIAVNGIDRRYDEQLRMYNKVHSYKVLHPESSPLECSRALNISLNTAKKYFALSEPPLHKEVEKHSMIDKSRNQSVIMTVSKSQDEILSNILRLYCKNAATFDCDLTVNIGGFYKHGIPLPNHLYDKFPQFDGVKPLEDIINLPNSIFDSIVIDLPFLIDKKDSPHDCIMSSLFNSFTSIDELYDVYEEMIAEASRLLKPNGILVFKTMDIVKFGKQRWISEYAISRAEYVGLELVDRFILVARQKLLRNMVLQHYARKNHSFFLIFKKVASRRKLRRSSER